MRNLAGPSSTVRFTHLSRASSTSLAKVFSTAPENANDSLSQAFAHEDGVLDLMRKSSVPLERVCLLDPKAEKELSPEDGDGDFEWFLFGVYILNSYFY